MGVVLLGWPVWLGTAAVLAALLLVRFPIRTGKNEAVHTGLAGNATNTGAWGRWAWEGPFRVSFHPFVVDYVPSPTDFGGGLQLKLHLRATLVPSIEEAGRMHPSALFGLARWQEHPHRLARRLRDEVLAPVVAGLEADMDALTQLRDGEPEGAMQIIRERASQAFEGFYCGLDLPGA